MWKKYALYIFVLLLAVAHHSRAQNFVDIVNINGIYSLPADFEDAAGNTEITEFSATINVPVKVNEKLALLPGLYFDRTELQLLPEASSRTALYTLNPRLGINLQHSDRWSGTYLFLPKISSDLKNIGRRDYQYGGIALLKYEKKPELQYKIGVYYNAELFGPFFVPLFGAYWQKNRWEINATLPLLANINYRLNPRWRAGFEFTAFVRSFDLNSQTFDNHYLVKSTNEPSLFMRYEPWKGILFRFMAGYSVARSYRVYDSGDELSWGLSAFKFNDDRLQRNVDFSDGLVLKLNMRYRFYLEQD